MPKNLFCRVVYDSNMEKEYTFRTTMTDLKQGDIVITHTSRDAYVPAIVVGYCQPDMIAKQWIVGRVDEHAYKACQGTTLHFCKVCGELLAGLHEPCPQCTPGSSGDARSNVMTLMGDDE